MNEQIGFGAVQRRLLAEAPYIVSMLPELPRLVHQKLLAPTPATDTALKELAAAQRTRNRWLALVAVLLVVLIATLLMRNGGA